MEPLKEIETRAYRTYRGGKLIDQFLGKENPQDSFQPEDWISSFTEAKNKNYIPNEGITRVLDQGEERLITEVVGPREFGEGRKDAGVLVKYLDSAERLGIQVHPTKKYAKEVFSSTYGKTEAWYILDTREEGGTVYLGFKEYVTAELWKELFAKQDIAGMLDAMHCFKVQKGDMILVTGGTPHAIGAGCFLLEIQEPSDYTMRVEKVTLAGEVLTPNQIHYGVGEEKMLACFEYLPRTEEEIRSAFFIQHPVDEQGVQELISYEDTPCFRLKRVFGTTVSFCEDHFVTVISLENEGAILMEGKEYPVKRGDKYFLPANCPFTLKDMQALICEPPERSSIH